MGKLNKIAMWTIAVVVGLPTFIYCAGFTVGIIGAIVCATFPGTPAEAFFLSL